VTEIKKIRTDVVGSLLRPKGLIEARQRFDEGKITEDEFRAIEDDAVRQQVSLQESVGLDILTDGEMRRVNFQDSFSEAVEGYDAKRTTVRKMSGASKARRRGSVGKSQPKSRPIVRYLKDGPPGSAFALNAMSLLSNTSSFPRQRRRRPRYRSLGRTGFLNASTMKPQPASTIRWMNSLTTSCGSSARLSKAL
jgi:hypothetical protein